MLRLVPDTPTNPRLFKDDPVEIYLEGLQGKGRRTQKRKLEAAAQYFNLDLANFWLTHLSYRSISAVRAFLLDAGRSPQTVNATLSALKGVAAAAANLGIITPEEHNKIKAVKSVHGSRVLSGRALNDEEKIALFEACARDESLAGARDAAILAILLRAGLRRDECARLRASHYSAKTKELLVRGKRDKERVVPIECREAARALNDWLSLYPGAGDRPMFCRIESGKASTKALSDQAIYNVYRDRTRQAGLANTSPHDARRTYATDLLDAGADLSAVQDLMGHASIATTKRYDHRGERAKRKAAGLLSLPYIPRRVKREPGEEPEQLGLPGGAG
jgi:site-specific recombinase XerD